MGGFKNLLRRAQVLDVKIDGKNQLDLVEDGGLILYRSGVATDYFTLVLEGKVEIFAGRQKFRSEQARWSIFCDGVLDSEHDSHSKNRPASDLFLILLSYYQRLAFAKN
eukprot:TRINITY_DN3235_c0_g1_i1.p1 TRINITY_DN3235_c0_g1~~TRINITY_DN3235_c0_g1_i1.p1  ORF type:complete len:109 (-),score=6.92 TRINITY_DN3235_c0_g1_i1:144-470(-)